MAGKNFSRLAEDTPTFYYASGWGRQYNGLDKSNWLAAPKRVWQASALAAERLR